MSGLRIGSIMDLAAPSFIYSNAGRANEHTLEGLSSHVMLLLKLIQDHNEASSKDDDERKKQRLAGMMAIIDDVKTRIQKSQSTGKKELRRCLTDLRPERKPDRLLVVDEKERLRRELHASLSVRKNLEIMCSSLGKEKEIMAVELSKKEHELNGMEELINDLKAQNEMLVAKVQACAMGHKEKKTKSDIVQGNNTVLQERNRELSELLLRSLEKYKALKRKLRDAQEENMGLKMNIEELSVEIMRGLDEIRRFKEQLEYKNELVEGIEEKVSNIESTLKRFELKISKKGTNESKHKEEITSSEPSVVA